MISWWRRRPLAFRDGVPGLIALVGGVVGVFLVDASRAVWPLGLVAAIGAAAAITVRRARPGLGFVLALASTVVAIPAQFEAGTDIIAAALCGYTVVAYRSQFSPARALMAMLGTTAIGLALWIAFFAASTPTSTTQWPWVVPVDWLSDWQVQPPVVLRPHGGPQPL